MHDMLPGAPGIVTFGCLPAAGPEGEGWSPSCLGCHCRCGWDVLGMVQAEQAPSPLPCPAPQLVF